MIELENIHRAYKTGEETLYALRDVTLTISAGEFVSIVGPSGSGKSTLMNILGCLDKPTSGVYRFAGRDVAQASTEELARFRNETIGFVFQQFHLLGRTTSVENVELPLVYARGAKRVSRKERRSRAIGMLERVGLGDRIDHFPQQLSGGQQQRVAIARALVNAPSVLFADEPTGNLDSQTGRIILEMLRELSQAGVTVVLVTHDAAIAEVAGRVIRVKDGRVE